MPWLNNSFQLSDQISLRLIKLTRSIINCFQLVDCGPFWFLEDYFFVVHNPANISKGAFCQEIDFVLEEGGRGDWVYTFYQSLCMFYFAWPITYLKLMIRCGFEYCIIWSNVFLWFAIFYVFNKFKNKRWRKEKQLHGKKQ